MPDAHEFGRLADVLRDADLSDSRTLAATEQRIMAIEDPADRGWLLARLAVAVARTGQGERATAIARAIGSPLERSAGLRGTARVLLRQGAAAGTAVELLREADGALDRGAPGGWQKPEELTRLARVYWAAGEQQRAERLWEEAVRLARAVEGGADRQDSLDSSSVLWEIAASVAEAGHLGWAQEIAHRIANPGARQRAIETIARISSGDQAAFQAIWSAEEA
jgi:hypothetical protein